MSRLGLLYVDALREKDVRKRLLIKAKIEEREETLKVTRPPFAEAVADTDRRYHDRVFWIVENSNVSYEEAKRLTIEERVNIDYRISKKIDEQNRRIKSSGGQP